MSLTKCLRYKTWLGKSKMNERDDDSDEEKEKKPKKKGPARGIEVLGHTMSGRKGMMFYTSSQFDFNGQKNLKWFEKRPLAGSHISSMETIFGKGMKNLGSPGGSTTVMEGLGQKLFKVWLV